MRNVNTGDKCVPNSFACVNTVDFGGLDQGCDSPNPICVIEGGIQIDKPGNGTLMHWDIVVGYCVVKKVLRVCL